MLKKFILYPSSLILIVLLLSGCKAIGTTKPAALQVTSTPEASVFLDGKHVGKTPFFSDQLQAKEYLVKLTTGEASYNEKVSLNSGTLTVITRELANNFLAQSGDVLWLEGGRGLIVVSMPDEANISLDGALVGKTPQKIEDIEEGEHKIILSKQGYLDREVAVKTSNKYQLVADVTLASQIAKGQAPQTPASPQPQKVQVQETPQGFLRVRRDASTASPEIGRVKDGDQLELVQETEDWLQVKFTDKIGWVSAQYIKKI